MTRWKINPEKITDYLSKLVSIDSINPGLVPGAAGETEIAHWLAETCRQMGFDTQLQEAAPGRPNVIARWRGSGNGRSLLMTGHVDVVSVENMQIPPFTPQIKDNRLYGRGAFDMKGGLAAILGAVDALRTGGFRPAADLILGFVVDEEYVSIGTEALVREFVADAAILTEPSEMDVCIAHRGYAWLTITTHGFATHGSLFDEGIDAISHMGRVIQVLEKIERDILPERRHDLLGRPSVHASLIEGGLGVSTYPDRCTLQIEHRLLPGESGEQVLAIWQDELHRLSAADQTFKATVELDFQRPGFEISRDHPIVQTLFGAYQDTMNQTPTYSGMLAWLDSAILTAAGIPTVILGPGGTGAHAAVEYVELADVHQCAAILAETAARWVGEA